MTAVTSSAAPPPPLAVPPPANHDEVPAQGRRRGSRARKRMQLWHIVLIPLCFIWVYPFLWMVFSAFKSPQEMLLGGIALWPEEWTLDNFVRAWTVGRFGEYTVNTVIFSVAVVVLTVLTASLAGYALSQPRLPGKKAIVGVMVGAMFVPYGYTIIPVLMLVTALGLQNGLFGAALAQTGPGLVVPVLLYMGFFAKIPAELSEAAKIDGAGFLRTFFQVMLPLAKPVTGTVVLMNFIGAWNAFMVPLVFTLGNPELRTLGVGMYNFFGTNTTDWTGLAAGATISIVPIVIIFLFLQRSFVEGVAGAVKN